MAWLSTDKAITFFLESEVSSTGTREFVIRFLFVIKFFSRTFLELVCLLSPLVQKGKLTTVKIDI